MEGTVHIPGIGNAKKQYVVALGVAAAAVIGYLMFRKHSAALSGAPGTGSYPADAAAGDTTGTDTSGGSGLYSDPYASYQADGASYGDQSVGNGVITGYTTDGRPVYGVSGTTTATATETEAEWVARAAGEISDSGSVSYQTASQTLIRWIGGQTLTPAQITVVQEAIHLSGNPPGGVQPIHPAPTTTPPSTGGGGTKPAKPGAVTGLHAVSATASSIRVDWAHAPRATGYHLKLDGHEVTTTVYSVYSFQGLKRNTRHTITVTPENNSGNGPAATIHASTKR